ncbi:BTAD domain-containing putative transcriptional regulator [Streptomyces bluensis]|uniref:BTAD domain-containing putative transcriptional regulator n=1 Tax=Streptomyces bluensis TaxID=33897 RepID=UPI0033305554
MHDQLTWYGLLGPVEVIRDGTSLALGPRQRRVLLTRLLLEDGRPVSVGRLCRDLWPDAPPSGAVSSLRAHISRLRSVLDPVRPGRGQSTVLVSEQGGYALKVPRAARDTARFEELVSQARNLLGRGQLGPARDAVDEALGLWRGGALGDAAEHAFAVQEAARLHTARQDAEELRSTLLIRLGDLESAIGAAEGLTLTAPLREASWALLMQALYGVGRSVEALQAYERFRTMLAEELGLDPSPRMRELHTAILRHDTEILGEPRPPRATVPLAPAGEAVPGGGHDTGDGSGRGQGTVPGSAPGVRAAPTADRPAPGRDASPGHDPAARHLPPSPGATASFGLAPLSGIAPAPGLNPPVGLTPPPGPAPSPGAGSGAVPLVGRSEETGRLTALLRAAAAGRAQWAVLAGEPGSGKTRLLEELAGQAVAGGFTVVRASGGQALSESDGVSLLHPTTQLLDALRPQRAGARSHPARGDAPDEEPLGREGASAEVVRALLHTERPLLCLIDDLHWVPSDFHRLLSQLATLLREAPVAVVCATRDADDPATSGLLAELARLGATRLHLEPLSVTDVTELLAALGEPVPLKDAAALHRRAEGNPFFLGELLKLPAHQRLGPAARVPAAVSSVLRARLAELDAPVRTTVAYASADAVAGAGAATAAEAEAGAAATAGAEATAGTQAVVGTDSAWLDIGLLADVQGTSADLLLPQLDAAVTARVLVWEAHPGEHCAGGYRFPELAREVVLSTLTPSARQLLHAALARELSGRPGAEPARLARHLWAAGPLAPAAVPERVPEQPEHADRPEP